VCTARSVALAKYWRGKPLDAPAYPLAMPRTKCASTALPSSSSLRDRSVHVMTRAPELCPAHLTERPQLSDVPRRLRHRPGPARRDLLGGWVAAWLASEHDRVYSLQFLSSGGTRVVPEIMARIRDTMTRAAMDEDPPGRGTGSAASSTNPSAARRSSLPCATPSTTPGVPGGAAQAPRHAGHGGASAQPPASRPDGPDHVRDPDLLGGFTTRWATPPRPRGSARPSAGPT
jgi:hypothetical protein